MFSECLVESRGLTVSRTQRVSTLSSITIQCALAGLLIALPLMRLQTLPMLANAPHLSVPFLQRPPVVEVQRTASAASSSALSAPAASAALASAHPLVFPRLGASSDDPAPNFEPNLQMVSSGPGTPGVPALVGGSGPSVTVVRVRPEEPVHLSSGVTEGMLLTPIQPVYPAIARTAGVQGAVVMEAVISKTGSIESLHAISGPQMLRAAALNAVGAARYRPYKLDGEPTEVQTTITIVFQLGR
jgi:protein TonB